MVGAEVWRVGDVVDGRYEVTRVHEHGGMGLVYRVRHLEWGTDLAVKCPRPELFRTDDDRERFVAEAEAWVSLGLHPNVCGCHYVRTLGGVPRVFAEYVTGGSLREWIDDRRLYEGGLPLIVSLAIQAAWGLEHAHSRGLVHQDVKPANVLLAVSGSAVTAKVTDFGLAHARAAASTPTLADVPGVSVLVPNGGLTRAYASPEQAAGKPLGRRTDIYSFAVSVLEMFTGGITWFTGEVAGEVLAARRVDAEPGLPALPPDLADLLERCLRHDPAERPASMAEVADGLARVYESVAGVPYPIAVPVAAELRADELNNRGLSLLDLGRPAEAAAAFAEAKAADPRHPEATYNAGLLRWRGGEITDEDLLAEIEAVSGDPAEVERERGDSAQGSRPIPWYVYKERPNTMPPLLHLRFTPDARWALSGCDGKLRLWDVYSGHLVAEMDSHVSRFDLSADARFAVTADATSVSFWDLGARRVLRKVAASKGWNRALWVESLRLSPDGRIAVIGSYEGTVLVWDTHTGEVLQRFDGHDSTVNVAVSPDGRFVLTTGRDDATARLWEVATGACVRVLEDYPRRVSAVWLGDGIAVLATYWAEIKVWDLTTGRCLSTMLSQPTMVDSVTMSADGRYVASCAVDDTVRLWEADTGRCLRTFRGAGRPKDVVFDAGFVVSAHQDNAVRWAPLPPPRTAPARLSKPREHAELSKQDDLVRGLLAKAAEAGSDREALALLNQARRVPGFEREPRVLDAWRALGRTVTRVGLRSAWQARTFADVGHLFAVELSADNKIAVTGGLDKLPRVWDVETGECLRTLPAQPAAVDAVGVSVDGTRVLSVSREGTVIAWSGVTGEPLSILDGKLGATAAAFSQDGRQALVAGGDSAVRLWDLDRGANLATLLGHNGKVTSVSLSGSLAASAGADQTVRLWDLRTGSCLGVLAGHTHWVMSVDLSADGRFALSTGGYEDRTIRLWDVASGQCVRVFDDEPDNPRGLSSVPKVRRTPARLTVDGRFAVTGGTDTTVRVWDTATGRCLRVLEGHRAGLSAVSVSADGRYVLSGGGDGVARLWELDWELG
ncbi:WD40 repeat domain-containing serine/threonine protein kinase [Actinokineospora sp. HUAS TT18]|uniref:WD40 repeat domain-containing serine/threonine protein kinase n=1 Tax=Actinokineospora sp. HUAS TT18 TaxID=3447451 RepID=UPI003F51C2A4